VQYLPSRTHESVDAGFGGGEASVGRTVIARAFTKVLILENQTFVD